MLKKPSLVCVLCLSSFLFAMSATAQEGATLVLKSGERISGELIDLGGVGFTMRVNGQNRNFGTNDVAVIEFAGGNPNPDVLARLQSGRQVVVLRNGQTIEGRLSDIGGTHPLRISVDTPSGNRDFTSSEVAQIYLASPPGSAPVGTPGAPPPPAPTPAGAIRVDANQPWVNTGLTVNRGNRILFSASGDIMVAPGMSAGVNGTPALRSNNQFPVPNAAVGALIGKVGNSQPFLVGSNTGPITMPADGQLMLGVNDDHFADNSGSFTVTIERESRRRPFGR